MAAALSRRGYEEEPSRNDSSFNPMRASPALGRKRAGWCLGAPACQLVQHATGQLTKRCLLSFLKGGGRAAKLHPKARLGVAPPRRRAQAWRGLSGLSPACPRSWALPVTILGRSAGSRAKIRAAPPSAPSSPTPQLCRSGAAQRGGQVQAPLGSCSRKRVDRPTPPLLTVLCSMGCTPLRSRGRRVCRCTRTA